LIAIAEVNEMCLKDTSAKIRKALDEYCPEQRVEKIYFDFTDLHLFLPKIFPYGNAKKE
jgi:hypothetical protein